MRCDTEKRLADILAALPLDTCRNECRASVLDSGRSNDGKAVLG